MENNYKTNNIEETISQTGTPSDIEEIEYDDSFLSNEDKEKLLDVILEELRKSPNTQWCDDIMINSIATWKYKKVVNGINREDYIQEKKETVKKDILSKLLI